MAHCCPNCQKPAPLLFGFCPECDFDMKDCTNGCTHKPKTMGEKYVMDGHDCHQCGEKLGVCTCYD